MGVAKAGQDEAARRRRLVWFSGKAGQQLHARTSGEGQDENSYFASWGKNVPH